MVSGFLSGVRRRLTRKRAESRDRSQNNTAKSQESMLAFDSQNWQFLAKVFHLSPKNIWKLFSAIPNPFSGSGFSDSDPPPFVLRDPRQIRSRLNGLFCHRISLQIATFERI